MQGMYILSNVIFNLKVSLKSLIITEEGISLRYQLI